MCSKTITMSAALSRGTGAGFTVPRSFSTYATSSEYYEPLPRRGIVAHEELKSGTYIDCLTSSIKLCDLQFTGPAFRSCVYGVLTASDVLPTGVARLASSDLIDAEGGYMTGLTYYCPYNFASNW